MPEKLFSDGVSPEEGFALGIARSALSAYGGSAFFGQVLRQIERLMDRWRVDPGTSELDSFLFRVMSYIQMR
jgi:hypothetical protein